MGLYWSFIRATETVVVPQMRVRGWNNERFLSVALTQ